MWSKFLFLFVFSIVNTDSSRASLLQCVPEELFADFDNNECKELEVGKSRRVKGHQASSGISVKDHYIQRTEKDKYQIFLNINFVQGKTGKTNSSEMMNKVKTCLEAATPNLRGPNGETLQLNALTPDEAKSLPKKLEPVKIGIESGTRANAEMYTDELNCGEVLHEVLHLLGLCDEYKETTPVNGNTYACRVVPEISTIMKNPSMVYSRATPKEIICKCDDACKKVLNSKNENLKNIYLSPSFYDLVDVEFRSKYCEPPKLIIGMAEVKDLAIGVDRSVVLVSSDANSFLIESREVSPINESLYRSNVSCRCPEGDELCLSSKKLIESKLVSLEGLRSSCPAYLGVENYTSKVEKDGYRLEDDSLIISKKGSGENFLYPNHWSKIMASSCGGLGSNYNECATSAYKSLDCEEMKQCSDEYFLGIKK